MKLSTHLHVVPMLRTSGTIPLHPHTPSWRGQRQAFFHLLSLWRFIDKAETSVSYLFVSLLRGCPQGGHKIIGISKCFSQKYAVLFDCCHLTETSVEEPTFRPKQML
jgi:hypothetical protein